MKGFAAWGDLLKIYGFLEIMSPFWRHSHENVDCAGWPQSPHLVMECLHCLDLGLPTSLQP